MFGFKFSEHIRRPPFFLRVETYLKKGKKAVNAHQEARHPRLVPLVVLDYGSFKSKIVQMNGLYKMVGLSIYEMWNGIRSIKKNPKNARTTISATFLKEIEDYAKSLGAADIGYTKVNPRHIFKGFHLPYPNAMVFTIEMDKAKIKTAPSKDSLKEVWRSYHTIGEVVNTICERMRQNGFNAYPGHAIGGDVHYIPLAIDAGLGYSGKNGLLITRKNGPRVRLAAVFTDVENLPFNIENEHEWVRDYCNSCDNCIKKCPAGAIFKNPKSHENGDPIFIDHKKCAVPFSNENGCTICIKVCPFSYGDYEHIKEIYLKQNTK
ncbi:MAG: 4Fe-4S dicluster domain-containing protein [Bacteroidota bacterium]